jgi:uncharacterized protein YraI
VLQARQNLIAVAALVVAMSSAMADPAVTDRVVKLRAGPGSSFGVIASVPPGTKLDTQNCGEAWCRVTFGRRTGYASRAYLMTGVDSYASAAPQNARASDGAKPTLGGPHIWQWQNEQWRNDHWRQLDWHNRMNAP